MYNEINTKIKEFDTIYMQYHIIGIKTLALENMVIED